MNWKEVVAGVVLGLAGVALAQLANGQMPGLRAATAASSPSPGAGHRPAESAYPMTFDRFMALGDRSFARLDLDHDGVLTADERLRAGGGSGPATGGPITLVAFRPLQARQFRRIDTDHDGLIEATEIAAERQLARVRTAAHGAAAALQP